MANKEIKTNAEIYREQRKARLAKAAKKKNSGKSSKAVGVLVKVLCIALVAAVVLYAAGSLFTNVFCVPQKVLTASTYDGESIKLSEYNYYYMSLYNQLVNLYSQYEQYYGQGYGSMATGGFNPTVDPSALEYTGSDAPEGVSTWADYFKVTASERAFSFRAVYEMAMADEEFKAEYEETLKDEIKTTVADAVKKMADSAKENNFSLDNYISKTVGAGITEKLYREFLTRDEVTQHYIEWFEEHKAETLTDDEVTSFYNEHKEDYDAASARLFTFNYAKAEDGSETLTEAEAKAKADEFLARITDEASFTTLAVEYAPEDNKSNFKDDTATLISGVYKSAVSQNAAPLANWLFDSARVAGDRTIINDADNSTYYVAYVVSPAARITSTAGADVCHILVEAKSTSTTTDTQGEETTVPLDDATVAANFEKAKKDAEELLKSWKDGEATLDSFQALALEKSNDTGVQQNRGLYEDVNETSNYVPEFKAWAIDPARKAGETAIVKTTYGYHIMYFVSADETALWESNVRSAIASEATDKLSTDASEDIHGNVKLNETVVNYFVKANEKLLRANAAQLAASASVNSSITY